MAMILSRNAKGAEQERRRRRAICWKSRESQANPAVYAKVK